MPLAYFRRGGARGGHVLQGAVPAPQVFSHCHLVCADEGDPEEVVK